MLAGDGLVGFECGQRRFLNAFVLPAKRLLELSLALAEIT